MFKYPVFEIARKSWFFSSCILSFFVLPISVGAQQFIYSKGLGEQSILGGEVVSTDIAVDNLGNTYITGSFQGGTVDFDPGPGEANLTSSAHNSQGIFIAKYDASGRYVFVKGIGGTAAGGGQGYAIALDASGSAYITGAFNGTVDFDPGAPVTNLASELASNSFDIFLAKYDASGNYVYAKGIGSTSFNLGYDIAVDGQGSAYIAGYFSASVDFDPGPGVAILEGNADNFIAKYNESGNYVYAKAIKGTAGAVIRGIAVDGQANAYITGYFGNGYADFDPGGGDATLTTSGFDMFMAKYDGAGNYVYAKAVPGTNDVSGLGIAVDFSGNVVIAGSFEGTADFDPGAAVASLTSAGSHDIFFARYTTAGEYVYARSIGGSNLDQASAVRVDGSGNVYIAGDFKGVADLDPGAGVASLNSAGNEDGFVAKYDASGNYVYGRSVGGRERDIANSIAVDVSGNTYITGYFTGTADFNPGAGVANLTIGGTGWNGFVTKLNQTGDYTWASQLGNRSNTRLSDQGRSIAADALGNTYVTGSFMGTVDFDQGPGVAALTSAGSTDIFIAKYDASGKYEYARAMGGAGSDAGSDIAVDASGNVYVTGYFSGTADFDPGNGTVNLASVGGDDIFIARYDASGNYVYAKGIGGGNADIGKSITVDGAGNVFVTGSFIQAVDFDPGPGSATLGGDDFPDLFIARYDGNGNYVFAKGIGSTGSQVGNGIALDASGNLYVTGAFEETVDFDPGTGIANLSNTGSSAQSDIFLAKYDGSGNYIFAKGMGSSYEDAGHGIAVDAAGNTYITGYFSGLADFDPGPGTIPLSTSGTHSIFLAKYDPAGNYVYAAGMGSSLENAGNSIAIDGSGRAHITGYFTGTVDFDHGADVTTLTSAGASDIFVAGYDPSGKFLYAKGMGGQGAGPGNGDVGHGIAVDGAGNMLVTGSFAATADFNRGGPSDGAILTAVNGEDIFIAKYGLPGALPIELVTFTARPANNGEAVQIYWSTASQTNNAWFEVERSKDGVQFNTVHRRPGCSTCVGLLPYEWIDTNPLKGRSYYRLRQVDYDNAFTYSHVEMVTLPSNLNTTVRVYPTITQGAFEIRVSNVPAKEQATIKLLSAAGSILKQEAVWLNEGDNRFMYSLSNQPRGIYYISVGDKKGRIASTVTIMKK